MRVLIASDTFYPHVNGASYFTQRLAAALAESGHDVAVVAPGEAMVNQDYYRGKVRLFGLRSFPVFVVPKFRFVLPFTMNRRIRAVLTSFKPDIVHIQMHFAVSRTTLAQARKLGIPVVATNHFMPDNLTHYLHLPDRAAQLVHKAAWADAAHVLGQAQGVSSPTHTAGAILKRRLPHMEVISNGIDLKRFNPGNDPMPARERYNLPRKPTLLFVGRLDKEKNVDVALRAFAIARKTLDIHFAIAGHGAEERRLKALADTLGIAKHVTFAGFVPDELLPHLYAAADCFVIAGIAELQCIVAMEAMATGLPVLAADAVALPELVHSGQNGYLFNPGDHDELAQYIIKMFTDEAQRRAMGSESLNVISAHDINLVLEAFEIFYRKAIGIEPPSVPTHAAHTTRKARAKTIA